MSSQAYYKNDEMVKEKMTISDEALFIVEELLHRKHAEEVEMTSTLEEEAGTIVAKLLADSVVNHNTQRLKPRFIS